MKSVDVPISLVVGKRLLSDQPAASVGAIRNVTITNLTATEPRPRQADMARPCLIAGLSESPIENVSIEHAAITRKGSLAKTHVTAIIRQGKPGRAESALAAAGFYIFDARNVRLGDVALKYETPDARPSLIARDVSALQVNACNFQKFPGIPLMRLEKVEKLSVQGSPGLSDKSDQNIEFAEE
jgi:hypothetical protein